MMKHYISFVVMVLIALCAVGLLAIATGSLVEYKTLHGANPIAGWVLFTLVVGASTVVAVGILISEYQQLKYELKRK